MVQRSLNMQLPRGWYQVKNTTPPTFRRHGLNNASGTLEITFEAPPDRPIHQGEQALAMLKHVLTEHHLAVGTMINSGHEPCAAGFMAHAAYKHLRGQAEFWLIPNEEATVFASYHNPASATAGMERHEIHDMLIKLHFEDVEAGQG